VKCVSALLTVGDFSTPLRALIYLAVSQREDGGFCQNFWIDGRPHWQGIQLDEVPFPILLAWRLWKLGALGNVDPYVMVRRACGFLIREGPVTAQDRWEEASGYSPSTLAVHIAALICAAEFFTDRGDKSTAEFVRDYADFLESHVERWTVTMQGTLVPGLTRHYIRINPGDIDHCADEDPNCGTVVLGNQRPGDRVEFPAKAIVDPGFRILQIRGRLPRVSISNLLTSDCPSRRQRFGSRSCGYTRIDGKARTTNLNYRTVGTHRRTYEWRQTPSTGSRGRKV